MPNINDFKVSNLLAARKSSISLRLQCLFPGYAQVGGEIEDLAFLCRSTQLPDMTIGVVNVPFRVET